MTTEIDVRKISIHCQHVREGARGSSPAFQQGSTGYLPEDNVIQAADPAACTYNLLYSVSMLIAAVNCLLADHDHADVQKRAASQIPVAPEMRGALAPIAPDPQVQAFRGGLLPWQIRRVTAYIEDRLGERIRCEEMSAVVRLSASYFSRAFRISFGCPPHAYVMKRRISRAQNMMLATEEPLGQIALECGLADQAHLTKLFQRYQGETPAAWRRARMNPL